MTTASRFLAFDFGAESGRAILGTLESGRISLQEIHRFPTQGLVMLGTRQWDITRLYAEMVKSLGRLAQHHGFSLNGIGVDTWGVDFGLVARDGTVLGNPVHYRDKRNEGAMDFAFERVSRREMYEYTGIQFLPFNTVFQLCAMLRDKSPLMDCADSLLLMGDLFGYLLSGKRSCEYTNASTTQLLDASKRTWCEPLIEKLGIPRRILQPLSEPGSTIGTLLPDLASAAGLPSGIPVIAPATHDTGAAIAAVPATGEDDDWAYLSSGTWSLLGAELKAPAISDKTYELNFTNEGGVNGTIRFLKNIIGLWIIQECKRSFERAGDSVSYADLMEEASHVDAFQTIIDVDDPRLLAPADMPETLRAIARETRQPEPKTRAALIRCAMESLALKYRRTLREMDSVLKRKTNRLHVIGGGVQNTLLCQMTADACGIPVMAGPVEATALGNIVVQALATGALSSLKEARTVVANSFELHLYAPRDTSSWDAAADR